MTRPTDVRFLTQEEVATLLRKSVKTVARLRQSGELAWLPGSPILVAETEVSAYLERRIVRQEQAAATPPTPKFTRPKEDIVARLKRQGRWEAIVATRKRFEAAKKDKM